jgi:hypothetical protein
MLEEETLHLLPWLWTQPGQVAGLAAAAWVRKIVAARGALLGFVHWTCGPSWAGVRPERLEISETEDAALLMALEHGWFAWGQWRVVDAVNLHVGTVVGAHLLDDQGFRFATLWQEADGVRSIRASAGERYARIELTADGAHVLRFTEHGDVNPFLRMMLLGAVVLQSARARRKQSRD